VPGTIHEDQRVLAFLGASLSEQQATLAEWKLPACGLLLLMNACENRCFFCANTGVTNPPPESITRFEHVASWLEPNRELALRRLCIVGTEPPRHPDFDRTLTRAREVGFRELEVMTSGLRLAERGEAERWAEHGVVSIAAPLYASEAAQHDAIVGRPAFATTVAGLDAAHRAGISVRVHTLALVRSLDALGPLSRFVRARYGTRLAVGPVRPKEALFEYEREAPALDVLERALGGIDDVGLVGLPRCIAPQLPRDAALCMQLYFRGQATGFVDACSRCAHRPECPGLVTAELGRAVVRPRELA
jgi:Radical SAM superfamily